jgi:NADH:ubiquinone oxidoreductase subunit 6 (subunit J)
MLFLQIAGEPTARGFWLFVIPLILGFLAVYLLLPRVRGYPIAWGEALAGLAVLAGGWLLIERRLALVETILFYSFSAIAIVSGGLMITQRNPVRAALSFALVVLSTCGLFLLQAAPFLMAATIIIYAGAIIVTFLFVIMLAQQSGQDDADHRSREPFLSTVCGFALLGALLAVLRLTYNTQNLDLILDRADRARNASSVAAAQADLGDEELYFRSFRREVDRAGASPGLIRPLEAALDNAQVNFNARPPDLARVKEGLGQLHEAGVRLRESYGNLDPPPGIVLSGNSVTRDRQGRRALPAENVAFLGRSLFTDFLLPVELGGSLLLIATIGAIAIASRRTEGLR